MDKTVVLLLFPFFAIVLIVGYLVFYTRGGRPIRLRLKGLGIEFTLDSTVRDTKGDSDAAQH